MFRLARWVALCSVIVTMRLDVGKIEFPAMGHDGQTLWLNHNASDRFTDLTGSDFILGSADNKRL